MRRKRASFPHFQAITTRWKDNVGDESPVPCSIFVCLSSLIGNYAPQDVYGHVNNAVYYSYFDTVINTYLIRHGGLNPWSRDGRAVVGFCVESKCVSRAIAGSLSHTRLKHSARRCTYFKPVAFPEALSAGLRVAKIGTSLCVLGNALSVNSSLCTDALITHCAAARAPLQDGAASGTSWAFLGIRTSWEGQF